MPVVVGPNVPIGMSSVGANEVVSLVGLLVVGVGTRVRTPVGIAVVGVGVLVG